MPYLSRFNPIQPCVLSHPVADSTYCIVNLVHGCVPRVQAVLPLRGKILNVERKDDAALLKNNEIANIIVALGLGSKVGSSKKGLVGSQTGCWREGLGSKTGCWREGLGSQTGCWRERLGSKVSWFKQGLGCNSSWVSS